MGIFGADMHARSGYKGTPTWVVLTLVATSTLLAGYTVLSDQHGRRTAQIKMDASHVPHRSYSVFNHATWSMSAWGKPCRTDLAPQRGAAPPGAPQLCGLPDVWNNCTKGIYLDIGSNVGVQIRKLYNPHQFPNASVLQVFDKVFGKERSDVCAIGVEANTHHTPYLQTLNTYFRNQSYQAMILTEVAASTQSGTTSFFLDAGSPVEWGASLTKGNWQRNSNTTKSSATVGLLNLPAFVVDVIRPILQQELHATGRMPPVAMKLDVEGEEYSIFPGLMLRGGLCDLSMLFLEVHAGFRNPNSTTVPNMTMAEMESAFNKMRIADPQCRGQVMDLDDESYFDGKSIALPQTHKAKPTG